MSIQVLYEPTGIKWEGRKLLLPRSRAKLLACLVQGPVSAHKFGKPETTAVYICNIREALCHAEIPYDVVCEQGIYKLVRLGLTHPDGNEDAGT